jgi:hypothetical protein
MRGNERGREGKGREEKRTGETEDLRSEKIKYTNKNWGLSARARLNRWNCC